MEDLYCKNCCAHTEHTEITPVLYICSICGYEHHGKVNKSFNVVRDITKKKEKVMSTGTGKGRRLSSEEKEALIEDLQNRAVSGESILSIAKKHGVGASTADYYAKKRTNKKKKKKGRLIKVKVVNGMVSINEPKGKTKWDKAVNPKLKKGKILIGTSATEMKDDKLFNTPINQLSGAKTFKDGLMKVLLDLSDLMIKKQTDYGHRNITDCGTVGVIIRMNDKISRLKNLFGITDGSFQQQTVLNECIKDTWRDIANYAIIALMLEDGTFTLPLVADGEKKDDSE